MRRWFLGTLFASLAVLMLVGLAPNSTAHAGQAAAQSSTTPAAVAAKSHGTFTVELVKPLDSKKLKEGDAVEAKLTGGITLPSGANVPRGTKVIGHVTEAKARAKTDSQSSLGISFDTIAQPSGDTSIHGVIQAVAPNPNEEITTGDYIGYHGLDEATAKPPKPDNRRDPIPILNETSQGVLGIKNMQLGAGGVLTSTSKDLKLDSGTRMLLNVTMQ
ncbi:MAG: hypothetical protein ACLPPV_09995 [Candidatus Korobacteraceae bacterium]